MELNKLPAKKKLLSQMKQQHAMQNQTPPAQSSQSQVVKSPAHSPTKMAASSSTSRNERVLYEDDDIIEIEDDGPLDMRIARNDSDDARASVIRRAPFFRETSNSPNPEPSSTCGPDLNIDDHFRRSLGSNYDLIMRNKIEREQRMIAEQMMLQQQEAARQAALQQQEAARQAALQKQQSINLASAASAAQKQLIVAEDSDGNEITVDDHFAKSLGPNWKQLQKDE